MRAGDVLLFLGFGLYFAITGVVVFLGAFEDYARLNDFVYFAHVRLLMSHITAFSGSKFNIPALHPYIRGLKKGDIRFCKSRLWFVIVLSRQASRSHLPQERE